MGVLNIAVDLFLITSMNKSVCAGLAVDNERRHRDMFYWT